MFKSLLIVGKRFGLWPTTKTLLAQHAHKRGLGFTDEKGQNLTGCAGQKK
jgi:hypothetical protein